MSHPVISSKSCLQMYEVPKKRLRHSAQQATIVIQIPGDPTQLV